MKLTYDYDARHLPTRQTLMARNVTMTTHVDYRYAKRAGAGFEGVSYAYDRRNRLTRVTTEKGKVVSYWYNGDNLTIIR
ncbi:hypothetical protein QJQ58_28845 [Paenibacillus dendritiformis]|uniref:hypothetical protein n=1 Tax=Paenibacillus dendritiformis TaxID=130049 RepID=UPI00248B5D4E|nr:hypothetical protein [Paenibacillus dendritiformis]WGU94448.1 hypothetical protein QJQ58_28845 [Paenibacillus dendritiformis]